MLTLTILMSNTNMNPIWRGSTLLATAWDNFVTQPFSLLKIHTRWHYTIDDKAKFPSPGALWSVKFPPLQARESVKCPGRAGMCKLRIDQYIIIHNKMTAPLALQQQLLLLVILQYSHYAQDNQRSNYFSAIIVLIEYTKSMNSFAMMDKLSHYKIPQI